MGNQWFQLSDLYSPIIRFVLSPIDIRLPCMWNYNLKACGEFKLYGEFHFRFGSHSYFLAKQALVTSVLMRFYPRRRKVPIAFIPSSRDGVDYR